MLTPVSTVTSVPVAVTTWSSPVPAGDRVEQVRRRRDAGGDEPGRRAGGAHVLSKSARAAWSCRSCRRAASCRRQYRRRRCRRRWPCRGCRRCRCRCCCRCSRRRAPALRSIDNASSVVPFLLPVRDQIGEVRSAPSRHQVIAGGGRVAVRRRPIGADLRARVMSWKPLPAFAERVDLLERVGEALACGRLVLQRAPRRCRPRSASPRWYRARPSTSPDRRSPTPLPPAMAATSGSSRDESFGVDAHLEGRLVERLARHRRRRHSTRPSAVVDEAVSDRRRRRRTGSTPASPPTGSCCPSRRGSRPSRCRPTRRTTAVPRRAPARTARSARASQLAEPRSQVPQLTVTTCASD